MSNVLKKINSVICDKIGRISRTFWRNRFEKSFLRNKQFTILSQNCIGSIMYHDIGVRFESPTVNLLMKPKDFIKFVNNIDFYLNQPLNFVESDNHYPVAIIGNDVTIYFVHYSDKIEAGECWERRKERINWQNIFIICCDDGLEPQDIAEFEKIPYNHKILFLSQKNLEFAGPSAVICKEFDDKTDARLLNFSSPLGQRYYQRYINYISFLNGEDHFQR
ncbi:TPA: DUF1919 domain-containing protein [Streptococcus suis]